MWELTRGQRELGQRVAGEGQTLSCAAGRRRSLPGRCTSRGTEPRGVLSGAGAIGAANPPDRA
ncbi:MAG: hypothetical protein ACLUI3_16755 [Christensenellales bacterium]